MSDRATRLIGLYALIAAGAAVLLSPLLALSYFATGGGADELKSGTVSAWAHPARDLVGGLLTWGSPDRVYGTYFLLFWVLFPSVFLCARAVRARRPTAGGRLERWGWRMALFGYGFGIVGLIVASMILVEGSAGRAVDVIGSTVLGIALLRDRYKPKLTAWLLALVLPSMLLLPGVLGNLSLGLLPVFFAWAVTGLRLWRDRRPALRSGRAQAA
jgi:hypothetical protein